MHVVTISLFQGKSPAYIRAVSNGVHQGLVESCDAPKDHKLYVFRQLEPRELIYDPDYLGIHRTDDLVVVHIVASSWCDTAKKKALFKAIADRLVGDPGLRPEDVLIVLSPYGMDERLHGNASPLIWDDDPA